MTKDKPRYPGCFITLEGVDGAGKSTHLAFIKAWLEQQPIPAVFTREPGGTTAGEKIRTLLLDANTPLALNTETLLMFAARQELLSRLVVPSLQQGLWVISDRFTDSTYAYQGGGRGVPNERIAILEEWVQQGLQPDLTLLFDLPVEQAAARRQQTTAVDRFEQEALAFYERVRSVYRQRCQNQPERFVVLDSTRTKEEVQNHIEHTLEALRRRRG